MCCHWLQGMIHMCLRLDRDRHLDPPILAELPVVLPFKAIMKVQGVDKTIFSKHCVLYTSHVTDGRLYVFTENLNTLYFILRCSLFIIGLHRA